MKVIIRSRQGDHRLTRQLGHHQIHGYKHAVVIEGRAGCTDP